MKIKNQLLLSIISFSIILAVIAASVIVTEAQTAQLDSQQVIAQNIQTGVSNLNYISNDYFLYQSNSSISLWQTQFAELSDNLSKLNSTDPQQRVLINNIYTDMVHLNTVFSEVVVFLETVPANVNMRVLPEFQTEWSRIAVQVQALVFDVQQLHQSLRDQVDQANTTNLILILAFLGVFGIYFVTNYIITYRRTLKSICDLKKGIEVIGSGNLHHLLKADKPDEIGEIAKSVNKMAANLKTVTASKADLEKEIAERKKTEAELERSTKQLKDAERLAAIGATAGMVGHDIRNPLQAITSDVYLIKSDLPVFPEGEAKEDLKESLDRIEKSVEYINKIVVDLQDYARPLKPIVGEIDFVSLCEDILTKTGIPKTINTYCEVEESAKQIITDPQLIRRVISNLVINAVQAMPQGGELWIYADRHQDDVIIKVKDTGLGIPDEVKPKLFTPLFTTKSKGQGFGLVVVKRMTETLGGTVSFESQVGKGTTFIIRLPANQREQQ